MRMRTTINLDDGAFRAETRAAQNGTTLAREVKDVLRADLHRDDAPEPVEPFAFPAVRGDCCPDTRTPGRSRAGPDVGERRSLLS